MLNEMYLDRKNRYVVGVSGGCDSMALLNMLVENRYDVIVCHVNYHKREDSDIDMQLVKDYALSNHLVFECLEVFDYEEMNFQAQARQIRYQFYLDQVNKYHCQGILLAHHYDDVIETIYMQKMTHRHHIYLGIKEQTFYQNVCVVRPLLHVRKQALRDYCHLYQVPYHDDYTNFETHYYRDYVRNISLKAYSDEDKGRLLEEAKKENERLEKRYLYIENLFQHVYRDGRIYYQEVKEEDLYDLYYYYVDKETDLSFSRMNHQVIEEMVKQTMSSKPNIQLSLPVNHVFIKEYDNVYVTNELSKRDYEYHFDSFEEYECAYFRIQSHGPINTGIPIKEEDYPITIRNYRKGDEMRTKGGTKKVNRLFIERKIPLNQRKTWPILLNKDGKILLIPNIAKNEEYLAINATFFVIQ